MPTIDDLINIKKGDNMAAQNKGQGQAGGPIHSPANIGPDTSGTMHGRPISDQPTIDGSANPPYPAVKEVKLGVVNDQEF